MYTKLFLAEPPFIVTKNKSTEVEYLTDFYTDYERSDEKNLRSMFLKFALQQHLVSVKENQTLAFADNDQTGSWLWYLNYMNMRSLVDAAQLNKLMRALTADEGEPLNAIIDLQARLGSLFDKKLLNSITNRIIHAVATIPYGNVAMEEVLTWEEIHKTYPFMWVVVFLQVIIRSEVK